MQSNTYQATIENITGMCSIHDGMSKMDLVKRIGAIQYACEQAMPVLHRQPQTLDKPMMERFRAFWRSLKAEHREYLMHAADISQGQEYKYSELYNNPDSPGPIHKAISEAARKANIGQVVTNNGQANGHRRWKLDGQLLTFIQQEKVAA